MTRHLIWKDNDLGDRRGNLISFIQEVQSHGWELTRLLLLVATLSGTETAQQRMPECLRKEPETVRNYVTILTFRWKKQHKSFIWILLVPLLPTSSLYFPFCLPFIFLYFSLSFFNSIFYLLACHSASFVPRPFNFRTDFSLHSVLVLNYIFFILSSLFLFFFPHSFLLSPPRYLLLHSPLLFF